MGGDGDRGLFSVVVFNAIYFKFRAKHQIIFLPNKQNFGRIFSSTTFLTRICSYSILYVNLCTSRRPQLQQKLEMRLSFLILS